MMRLFSTAALPLALVAAAGLMTPSVALAAKKEEKKEEAGKLAASAKFAKVAKPVQDLIVAKDFAGAQAKMAEAEAAAETPDDKYFVGNFYLSIGTGIQNTQLQGKGIDMMLASGKVAPDQVSRFELEAGKIAQINKNMAGARDHYNKAIAAGATGGDAYVMLAETYFGDAYDNIDGNTFNATGKAAAMQGLPFLKKAIEAETAAGRAAPQAWYVRGMKMSVLAADPAQFEWTKLAVQNAPSAENWRIALRALQDANPNLASQESLDLFRLMRATKTLQGDYSYSEYAEQAWRAGYPGEVVSLIDAGTQANEIKKERYADLYKLAQPAAEKDKPSLAASEASAAKAPTGRPAANTGTAYMTYGNTAKAIELYKLALTKGGVDANEINTRLGIALAQSGDKAGAKAAFAAVTGTGVRKNMADLWTVWLDQAAGGTAASL